MKEIGGYIEFETYYGQMLHSDGVKLNCGRNCLAYLILAKHIKKIALPFLMCDSVFNVCKKYGLEIRYYHVNVNFQPEDIELASDEWLYLMSFYGQLTTEKIKEYVQQYKRVIVDFSHDYFHKPIPNADTLYTCRKFFGVPDGAVLYTNVRQPQIDIKQDESFERIHYLLGRYERSASEFYNESAANNKCFANEPIKWMSKLTENLLHGINYERIRQQRTSNYTYLHEKLAAMNKLDLRIVDGAYAYPLMIEEGAKLKKRLIDHNVFVPTLWPNVLQDMEETDLEYYIAKNTLPLPCDQRYSQEDMQSIINLIFQY